MLTQVELARAGAGTLNVMVNNKAINAFLIAPSDEPMHRSTTINTQTLYRCDRPPPSGRLHGPVFRVSRARQGSRMRSESVYNRPVAEFDSGTPSPILSRDTAVEVERLQIEAWRRMSTVEKAEVVSLATRDALTLA